MYTIHLPKRAMKITAEQIVLLFGFEALAFGYVYLPTMNGLVLCNITKGE